MRCEEYIRRGYNYVRETLSFEVADIAAIGKDYLNLPQKCLIFAPVD